MHLHSSEASETVKTSTAVLSETRAIFDRYFKISFTKGITIKDYYIELNFFSYADWPVCILCETKMLKCFALVWNNTHAKTYAILSFFLNWTCFNVVVFCLQWTPTVIYLYLVWVINWQPVWLEYCWHAVNLDKQTLDICILFCSLFLECTFDMNICYMYLFCWENKQNKYNKVNQ